MTTVDFIMALFYEVDEEIGVTDCNGRSIYRCDTRSHG
jgi:hypothetical protein